MAIVKMFVFAVAISALGVSARHLYRTPEDDRVDMYKPTATGSVPDFSDQSFWMDRCSAFRSYQDSKKTTTTTPSPMVTSGPMHLRKDVIFVSVPKVRVQPEDTDYDFEHYEGAGFDDDFMERINKGYDGAARPTY